MRLFFLYVCGGPRLTAFATWKFELEIFFVSPCRVGRDREDALSRFLRCELEPGNGADTAGEPGRKKIKACEFSVRAVILTERILSDCLQTT